MELKLNYCLKKTSLEETHEWDNDSFTPFSLGIINLTLSYTLFVCPYTADQVYQDECVDSLSVLE